MMLLASPSTAQVREPIRGIVADLRLASLSLPTSAGWTPAVPSGTVVPSRTVGLDMGLHLFPASLGPARLGVGASLVAGRGTTKPPADTTAGADVMTAGSPRVRTSVVLLLPSLSLNFGHRLGWSYLSVGPGRGRVTSHLADETAPASAWGGAWHAGAGARWFVRDRAAVSLDLRWHRLSGRPQGSLNGPTPASAGLTLSAGVSVR